jgi:hypothetical protein
MDDQLLVEQEHPGKLASLQDAALTVLPTQPQSQLERGVPACSVDTEARVEHLGLPRFGDAGRRRATAPTPRSATAPNDRLPPRRPEGLWSSCASAHDATASGKPS